METWHQNRYHRMRFSPNFEMLHFWRYRMSGIVYIRPSHTSSQLKGVGCVSTPQIHIRPAKIWILTSAPGHAALRWGRASNRGWREQTGRDTEDKGSEPSARRNNGGHFDFRPPSFHLKPRNKGLLCRINFTERQKQEEGIGKFMWGGFFFSFFFKSHQGTHYNFIISRKTK